MVKETERRVLQCNSDLFFSFKLMTVSQLSLLTKQMLSPLATAQLVMVWERLTIERKESLGGRRAQNGDLWRDTGIKKEGAQYKQKY